MFTAKYYKLELQQLKTYENSWKLLQVDMLQHDKSFPKQSVNLVKAFPQTLHMFFHGFPRKPARMLRSLDWRNA